VNKNDILAKLKAINLSPAAVVNDGCIIEAASLFKDNKAETLQTTMKSRLSAPVQHLKDEMQKDISLKNQIESFSKEMSQNLSSSINDETAMRKELESDIGRAFLLCLGALD